MKVLLKSLLNVLATLVVLLPFAAYWVAARVAGAHRTFPGCSQAFSLIPGQTGVYLRRALYRLVLPSCERDVTISFGTIIAQPTAEFGRYAYVGAYCVLGDVTLHRDVLVGSHVSIMNGAEQHGTDRLDIPVREQPGVWPRVTIGQDTWIGDQAVVMADVGAHCVVGAGAVVTKPLPDYAVAVGNPARVVRYRNNEDGVPTGPCSAIADRQ